METSTPTAHGTTAPAQSNSILERLRARDAQRIAGAVKRAEEAKSSADPQECVAAFLEQFAQTHSQLELSIASAVSNQASKAELDGLAAQVAELEQNVAGAAYFLPPYDLRQVTNNVTALKASIDAAVVSVQPKAKFSFSSKVKAALKPAPVPATSANNNSQTPIMTTDTSQQPPSANKESEQPSSSVTFADKSNETINVPRSQIQGQDVMLTNLTNCIVCLPAPLAALFVHGLRNCTIVTGPVAGATYIEGERTIDLLYVPHLKGKGLFLILILLYINPYSVFLS